MPIRTGKLETCRHGRQQQAEAGDGDRVGVQVHAVDESGKAEVRRKLRRSELRAFFEKQEACTVVMEACGAAHHWARMLTGLGHDVKLIAPEAVRPFVKKGKKNDPKGQTDPKADSQRFGTGTI